MEMMREVYARCMAELMEQDPDICILDADLARANGTLALYERFPERLFNCGIAEQNMASIAAGLASYGFKPFIETFTPFASRRICDQIAISISYAGQNVKIVGMDPGISAELNGGTHMSVEDIGVLRSIPGLVIFEPVDRVQLTRALPVVAAYPGCMYIRMYRKVTPDVFGEDYVFDLFKADLLREGSDLTIVVSGMLTADTLQAAEILENEGISCDVLSIHTIKPIDRESIIRSAKKTGAVLTVENHNVIGGLYSSVAETLGRECVPIAALGIPDRFGEVGKIPYLREVLGMTTEDIVLRAKELLADKRK